MYKSDGKAPSATQECLSWRADLQMFYQAADTRAENLSDQLGKAHVTEASLTGRRSQADGGRKSRPYPNLIVKNPRPIDDSSESFRPMCDIANPLLRLRLQFLWPDVTITEGPEPIGRWLRGIP